MSNQQKNGSIIAIITMMFLYAMIAFVTNLAAPIGVVMKNDPEVGGSNMLAMLGNFMNFFAYLFMGIPAGKMLTRWALWWVSSALWYSGFPVSRPWKAIATMPSTC